MSKAAHDHLGFVVKSSVLRGQVYIPKYYNPEIAERLHELEKTHDLVVFEDLVNRKEISVSTGDEIGKMAYGTGLIPFIRTSDISNWEIKADPKQGVSEDIYVKYARKQGVKLNDVLFVRDGTYLIGSACLVTDADAKMLYQSHILKFRVAPNASISAPLLLAILSSPIVRRQIRAKQFTADIIDTIGNRYLELVLPVPKSARERERIERSVIAITKERAQLRERIRRIPLWAQGLIKDVSADIPEVGAEQFEASGNLGFTIKQRSLNGNIFIPRYYDPKVKQEFKELSKTHDVHTIDELVEKDILSLDTGVEVGKMAYGTGQIPFIRTSDMSNWEIKSDPKQNVSEEIYEDWKLDVKAGDIFVVRDGTYLVGISSIVTKHDTKILFSGGIYKIRVKKPQELDPYLLLALLNMPIVRRQMKAKQFTRDVIDTLGKRLYEIAIPIPKDPKRRNIIADVTRETVETRVTLRNMAKQLAIEVEGKHRIDEEDLELIATL